MKSFYVLVAALLSLSPPFAASLQAQSPQTFNYTGSEQTFTVPAGVSMVHVIAFAATGGAGNSGAAVGAGGKGGKVEADLTVTPGQTLYLYVGGKGIQGGAGGFNGGGGPGANLGSGSVASGGGGGATDIRIGGNALSNRVLVAGGGGGAGAYSTFTGGNGGGLTGGNGSGNNPGTGGSQGAGGNTGGASGFGGSGTNVGGGGGGYYGGGYASAFSGGGGGGSSYTDLTLCSNVVHTQGASNPNSDGSLVLSWTAAPPCTPPTAYALIGDGGRSCDGSISIILDNSESDVTYQLKKDGNDVGDPVNGIDNTLDFGDNFTESGTYTIVATRTADGCTADMTGSIKITPCFTGLGTTYCADDNTPYVLEGSDLPNGTFSGSGITDNGDGTATFTPSAAGTGGRVTYTVGTVSVSQNVAAYLCIVPPTFTGLDAEYCDLDDPAALTGSLAPKGFFQGPGITDNGDGTASFDPGASGTGSKTLRYLVTDNINNAWVKVAGGYYHTVAIKTDGTLWAWGVNNEGELGTGNTTSSDIPVQIGTDNDWASVSGGGYHTLAIKTNGTLWAWGWNPNGALGIGNTVDQHAPVQVGTAADWADAKALIYNGIGIKTDGTLWGWGWNSQGELGIGNTSQQSSPVQIGSDTDWASIETSGNNTTIASKIDGTLWGWGWNSSGELGIGNTSQQLTPIQVGLASEWAKLSMGRAFTLGIKPNGTLWAWGNNQYGQLGQGNNSHSPNPLQVGTATDWEDISVGNEHSFARKSDGTLWTWGYNAEGQLGNGNTTSQNTPAQMGTASDWAKPFGIKYQSFALKTDGHLLAWGYNGVALGNGSYLNSNTPTPVVTASASTQTTIVQCPEFTDLDANYCQNDAIVNLTGNYAPEGTFSGPGITDNGNGTATFDPSAAGSGGTINYEIYTNQPWAQVSAGYYHTLAIKGDGTLWGWGYNGYEVIGNGTDTDSNVPVQAGTDTDWADVSAGYYHSIGVKTDGTLWGWGYDYYGELGGSDSNVPAQIGSGNTWADVEAGYYRSFGIKTDGTLWAWGYNGNVLGNGNNTNISVPVQIGTATNWVSVSTHPYSDHVLALRADGTLWAWGNNDYGQLGTGDNNNSNVPVQVGTASDWQKADVSPYHSLAIKTDGALWTWGYNGYGELGDGSTDDSNSPVLVSTGWADVAGGDSYSLGVKTDGTRWGWGYNGYGNLGNGTEDDSSVPVQSDTETNWSKVFATASEYFSFALKADGNLFGFGYNYYGYLGDGTENDSSIPVQVGDNVTFAATTQSVSISPAPDGIQAANISVADCKNTTCTTDDTFTADITVTYDSKPASGTLSLTGPTIVGAVLPVNVGSIGATSYTFTGVTLQADGEEFELTAAFSVGCDYTDDEVDYAPSCQPEYVPTNITVAGFGCTGPNGNYTPAGTLNGAPKWESVYGPGNFRIVWTGSQWEIQEATASPYAWAANNSGFISNLPCSGNWTDPLDVGCIASPITLTGGCGSLVPPASPACDITNISLSSVSGCNDNSSATAADDYFTANVTVTFAYAPAHMSLRLMQGATELTSTSDDLSCTTTYTFTGVQIPANGQPVVLTAEFFEVKRSASPPSPQNNCTYTSGTLMTAPNSCSCVATSAFTTCPSTQAVNVATGSCANTVTYNAVANGTPAPTYAYEFTGASSGSGSGTGSGSSFNKGATLVKITATNDCGSAMCQFTVTVTDNIPPTLTPCPANVSVDAASDQCGNTATWTAPTANDNCPGVQTNSTHAPGAAFLGGTTTVTYTATDGAGLTTACSFTVQVGDKQNPSIVCPQNIVRSTSTGQCTAAVSYTTPTFSDNCVGATLTRTGGPVSGAVFSKGTTMVEWQATDAVGNSAVCQFTVTVNDLQAPVITCPANIVRNMDTGGCGAVVTYATPTATDNCGSVTTLRISAANTASGSSFSQGTTVVSWQASDLASPANTSSCSFTVTVNDTQLPSISCPSNQTVGNTPGSCDAVVNYVAPTYTDNCTGGSATIQSGLPSGSNFPKGISTVVWKATDGAGLTKTCSFRVTVNDTEAPVITCPTVAPVTSSANACNAVVTYPAATATDNCPGAPTVTRLSGPVSGSTFSLGATSVVWRAVDGAGRSSTCSFAVIVTDATPPTITCPNSILVTGSGSPCTAVATYTTPTATDNCGVQSKFLLSGQPSGSSFPAGVTVNTWRAVDNSGKSATCSFTVTVGCGASPSGMMNQDDTHRSSFIPDLSGQAIHHLSLNLVPNPATTEVQISIENLNEAGGELTLTDSQGRLIWRQSNVQHPTSTVSLEGFAAGLYFVTLRSTDGQIATKRLVKMAD